MVFSYLCPSSCKTLRDRVLAAAKEKGKTASSDAKVKALAKSAPKKRKQEEDEATKMALQMFKGKKS